MSEKSPIERGLEGALRLKEIECARWKKEAFRWQKEYASAQSERAALQELLANRASQTGEQQMPLNPAAASRFFERKENK